MKTKDKTEYQTWKEITFWLVSAAVLILGIYMVFYIQTESYKCLNNSYTYSVSLLEKANHANISCLCTAIRGQTSMGFIWTDKGFSSVTDDKIPMNITIPDIKWIKQN